MNNISYISCLFLVVLVFWIGFALRRFPSALRILRRDVLAVLLVFAVAASLVADKTNGLMRIIGQLRSPAPVAVTVTAGDVARGWRAESVMKKIIFIVVATGILVAGGMALFYCFSRQSVPTETSVCGGDVASADVLRELADRISSISSVAERRRLALAALMSMRELDISQLPLEERRRMIASNFFFEGVFPFASALNHCGFSEEKTSSWMMAGWKCYRDLCVSFDDADASSSAAESRSRRELARKSQQFYANDYRLMDSRLIGLLFADMTDGAEERFRAKWKAAFAEPDASGR